MPDLNFKLYVRYTLTVLRRYGEAKSGFMIFENILFLWYLPKLCKENLLRFFLYSLLHAGRARVVINSEYNWQAGYSLQTLCKVSKRFGRFWKFCLVLARGICQLTFSSYLIGERTQCSISSLKSCKNFSFIPKFAATWQLKSFFGKAFSNFCRRTECFLMEKNFFRMVLSLGPKPVFKYVLGARA